MIHIHILANGQQNFKIYLTNHLPADTISANPVISAYLPGSCCTPHLAPAPSSFTMALIDIFLMVIDAHYLLCTSWPLMTIL